jgi:hypothetical protein
MLMRHTLLSVVLFLTTGFTSAEAQFCYPGGCRYHGAPFTHRGFPYQRYAAPFAYRPLSSAYRPLSSAYRPMSSALRNGRRGYGYVPGALGNPYATDATAGDGSNGHKGNWHGGIPGGLDNPYTTSVSNGGGQGQNVGGGGQRYSGGGYAGVANYGDGNGYSGGGGQPGNGGYVAASGYSVSNFRYSCTINASEEDAGAVCKRTSSTIKHSGDRCSCHGEWGTVD